VLCSRPRTISAPPAAEAAGASARRAQAQRSPPPAAVHPLLSGRTSQVWPNPRSSRVGTARYLDVSWTGEPFLSFFFPGVGLHQDEAYVLDQRNAVG
jgi:hypothetical protein